MTAPDFAVFDTAIGRCAIAWGPGGILGVQLPEGREADTRARVLRLHPGAREARPTAGIQSALDAIVGGAGRRPCGPVAAAARHGRACRIFTGASTRSPAPSRRARRCRTARSQTASARADCRARWARRWAGIPSLIVVPCHRVLAAGGRVGGFSASGGITTKLRLLAIEGRRAAATPSLFDGDGAFGFDPAAAVAHVRASDPALARLIDAVGPFAMELKTTPSLFVALAESIVYQQLTGKAAATIFARVPALCSRARITGPTPEQILRVSDERLRGAGLSSAKLLALRDLARRSVERRAADARPRRSSWTTRRDRAAHRGARHRPLDGRDAADVPPRPPRRAAGGRLRRQAGLRHRLSQAEAAAHPRRLRSTARAGRRTERSRAGTCGAPSTWPERMRSDPARPGHDGLSRRRTGRC